MRRPYAKVPGGPPSVTQVLSLMSLPGLPWAAARETALYAVYHRDKWESEKPSTAVNALYKHHRGIWDHRALLGTAVHEINAAWCQGKTVKVIDIIQELREGSPLWRSMPETDIYRDLLPMTDGLAKAWHALEPEILSWEQAVRYGKGTPEAYVGTTDWRCQVDGRPLLMDLKTTGKVDLGAAKYWDSWRLQLAAYRYATEAVSYDDEGQETGSEPLPPVDGCAILHLYADGNYEVNGIQAGPAEHEIFLALRKAYEWRQPAQHSPGPQAPVLVRSGY